MAGTITLADLYNMQASPNARPDVVSASGPNQSDVAPPTSTGASSGSGPAMAWLGLVLALVVWRVVVEMGGRAD